MSKVSIFYASDTTPNTAFSFQSNVWRNNLYLSLVELGHDVIEFQYNLKKTFQYINPEDPIQRAFIEKNRPKLTRELVRQVKAAHYIKPIDLFFSYFYDACVLPEGIDEIREMGITTVNWYCNGSYQLHLVSEIAPHYDWCLVPEKFRLQDYIAMGAKPIYSQEAANPNIYKPYDLPKEFDVSFVGQAYGDRPNYIKYLVDRGIDVRVWGDGWRSYSSESPNPLQQAKRIGSRLLTPNGWELAAQSLQSLLNAPQKNERSSFFETVKLPSAILGEPLSDLEMIKMYSRSKINLGFSTCGDTHRNNQRIVQIRLRDFEVPMSGGFYMVEYMEELKEFFEIGKEIVCYTDAEDLADKIKYYLTYDTEREAIARAGYERCRHDHTWHKRFQMVFEHIGLS